MEYYIIYDLILNGVISIALVVNILIIKPYINMLSNALKLIDPAKLEKLSKKELELEVKSIKYKHDKTVDEKERNFNDLKERYIQLLEYPIRHIGTQKDTLSEEQILDLIESYDLNTETLKRLLKSRHGLFSKD